ncbi:electron transport complex subunit RsxC [Paratissierella segnis]|jgi:electron transport complex protein RnfC|uniref:Ion-translocating oxidoreductase complex subunit C n=1 Tax=Paratissierella segnis TaxID=2763679 RepID=A0A926IKA2_9FIRM|nr:electron transport complex subunit RsxC [Paratissierella segnis]MBC8588854.1 electron transport complex subunit RsxC [Paratissierella segnis]
MRLDNLTFKGGIHIPDHKELTKDKAIERANDPKMVFIPLHQNVGAPCESLVKVGDQVKVGQKIGDSKAFVSAPVHSSVSGVVKSITTMYIPTGKKSECIVIESDGQNELFESVKPKGDLDSLTSEEIFDIIREAGIVGLGGAAFPCHAKIVKSDEKKVDEVILNGAECEPYLTCDHRLMLEGSEKIIYGLKVLMKYTESKNGFIGIENNKMDAINAFSKVIPEGSNIKLANLKTKFPQGDSYRMVYAITGKTVPQGGRCKDVGVVVNNVATAYAIAEAILEGKPLYERVVTVTGSGIKEPKNLLVKVGTTIGDLIEQCGGFNGKPGKIIAGGPMTGTAQFTLDTPVTKCTSGIIVLTDEESKPQPISECIRCGKCLEVCSVGLQPLFISAYSLKNNFDEAEKYNATACIECGACSYVCPAKRPLTESIKHAKHEIKSRRKKS